MDEQKNQKARLKLYDTAQKTKREFVSLSPGRVKMYCCGPTVYDYLHIGNFRGAVFFNFVRNWLEFLNYQVDYVYNFTDIEDKILKRSLLEGSEPSQLAEKYIKEFKKDYQSLKLSPHRANPRATETLSDIIQLIQKLIDGGYAYLSKGNVFYSVRAFKPYGALSGRRIEELLPSEEEEFAKKDPLDFALWKKSKEGENWRFDSPWGEGRPGWHIECTAMIHKFLGEEIDIHAGGTDLIFPHHENEIAQAQSACPGKTYVRYWLHNNMIVSELGDKMSKSEGNMISMREFLKEQPGELFKFMVLSCHYRSPLRFSKKTIQQALRSLVRIYSCLKKAKEQTGEQTKDQTKDQTGEQTKNGSGQADHLTSLSFFKDLKQAEEELFSALNDDFATPRAFALLFSLLSGFQKMLEHEGLLQREKSFLSQAFLDFFKKYGKCFALFQEEPSNFLSELELRTLQKRGSSREEIQQLMEQREKARASRDFKTADRIRHQLEEKGVQVKDSAQGQSTWDLVY